MMCAWMYLCVHMIKQKYTHIRVQFSLFLQLVNRINWQSFPSANNNCIFPSRFTQENSGNGEKSRRKNIKNFTLQIACYLPMCKLHILQLIHCLTLHKLISVSRNNIPEIIPGEYYTKKTQLHIQLEPQKGQMKRTSKFGINQM